MYYDWVIATLFSMVYPYWSEGMASTPWSPPVLTVQLAQSLKRRPSQFHSDLVKDKHKRSTDYACWRRTSPGGEAWCYCCRTSRWACAAKRRGVENLWSGVFFHTRFIQFCVCLDTPLSLSIHCLVPGSPLVACILHVHLINLFSSRNSLC